MFGNMEKIAAFIIWFIIWGGITIAILYLIEFGFTNPLYIDWNPTSLFYFPYHSWINWSEGDGK